MTKPYFAELIPALANRSTSGAMGWLNYANQPLRKHLYEHFQESYGKGSFIGDPTFEATYGWTESSVKFRDLSGKLLEPDLISALDSPRGELSDYRFEPHFHPYEHQISSWNILSRSEPTSLLVSSGTGSGKTECFLFPILNQLIRERNRGQAPQVGVKALFLYPLNALIDSQQKRLDAWTKPFNGDIRFCLYNGNTPNELSEEKRRERPNEVIDRETLRKSPPPILVTNPTMLEFMLVRPEDHPIIQKSQGQLEWIVLDEAHTYIGSQAAELSLLLRRVLLAFGRKNTEVRFVATSATLGSDKAEKLKQFVAKLAGVSIDRVEVVQGKRFIPLLPFVEPDETLSWDQLGQLDASERYDAAIRFEPALDFRKQFIKNQTPARRLSELGRDLYGWEELSSDNQSELLEKIDILTEANTKKEAFLPLRGHVFHKTFSGLWACADPDCAYRKNTHLDSKDWPFGFVSTELRQNCKCGGPIYELVACDDCQEVFLLASREGEYLFQAAKDIEVDEFQLELDTDELEDSRSTRDGRSVCLLTKAGYRNSSPMRIDPLTRRVGGGDFVVHFSDFIIDDRGCPNCDSRNSRDSERQFRDARIGAPYLLNGVLPTLLEYATDAQNPKDKPFYGRRVLTFSDSRQGTARLAARLQQDTERTFIRSLIYHNLAKSTPGTNNEVNELNTYINSLEKGSTLREYLEKKRQELISSNLGLSLNDLVSLVANSGQDFSRILDSYKKFNSEVFGGTLGSKRMALILILREFGRRPKRSNNLETMGMVAVDYEGLSNIDSAPDFWKRKNRNEAEWRAFLKILLDHVCRGRGALDLQEFDAIHRWFGLPYRQSYLLKPMESPTQSNQTRWPNVKTGRHKSLVVRYLSTILKLNYETKEDSDIADILLQEAFEDLKKVGLLSSAPDGFLMPSDKIRFRLINEADLCPITHRFLDTTVSGITPYQAKGQLSNQCKRFILPVYHHGYEETDPDKRVKSARKWLSDNSEQLLHLRTDGYWTVYNDRVIENSPFFVTAEHSAQVSSSLLKEYANKFRDGDINLLSCSTTMEMGIDIGGVSVVGMNNVPPHPANYLQRAGRAGRRRESRSLVFTLCKSNPHDLFVFQNSDWAFTTQLPIPQVDLHSRVIVQRHVNSLALSHFFLNVVPDRRRSMLKLTCGEFFDGSESLYQSFEAWIMDVSSSDKSTLNEKYQQLIVGSKFEKYRVPLQNALEIGLITLPQVNRDFLAEVSSIRSLLQEIGTSGRASARRAIEGRLERLMKEYLLKELSMGGYLPGYGFPTHIAPFDNMTIVDQQNERDRYSSRDDNRYSRRELPSRDTVSALREYAPGSHVVIDGRVYKSSGITLNWHQPASEAEANEIQSLRFSWRCSMCGASGTASELTKAQECSVCKSEIDSVNIIRYVEPAGFTVDYFEEPDNNLTKQEFIPVEPVWVDSIGDWIGLANGLMGRYRATSEGHIFHHSMGISGHGYALCLSCGRMEAMKVRGELPPIFTNDSGHDRVRRTRKSNRCSGSNNPWAIKKGIALGVDFETDVIEFNLKSSDGNWLTDTVVAKTLAVAFRQAIASLLGIQTQELDCANFDRMYDGQDRVQSIVIFDRYNAGYSTAAEGVLDRIFDETLKILKCSADCDAACPKCILDFDHRMGAGKLDRKLALSFLRAGMKR